MEINQEYTIEYYVKNFLQLSIEDEEGSLLALSKISESVLAVMTVVLNFLIPSPTRIDSEDQKVKRCMLQYMAGKQLAIHNQITTKHFVSINDEKHEIKDNTPIIGIVRSMYEMLLIYHSIFMTSKTEEERVCLLNIWKYKGLKFPAEQTALNFPIVEIAKQEREKLLQNIEQNPFYKHACKQKILKDSLTYFEGTGKNRHLSCCSFQNGWKLLKINGIFKESVVENMYSRLCTETHPTYYGLIMYENQDNIKPNQGLLSLYLSCVFLCIMLSEIISQDDNIKNVFESLDEIQQGIFLAFVKVL